MALSPDGARLWVSVQSIAGCDCTNEIAVFGVADGALKMSVSLPTLPSALFFGPKGDLVYVLGGSAGVFSASLELLAIEASTGNILDDKPFSSTYLGQGPYYSLSPNGQELYVSTSNDTDQILAFKLPSFAVSGTLNLAKGETVNGVSATSDGAGLLVAAQNGSNSSTLTLYKASDFSILDRVSTTAPAIAVTTASGSTAYALTLQNNSLSLLTIGLPSLELTPGPAVPGYDGYGALELLFTSDGTKMVVAGGILVPEIVDLASGTVQNQSLQTPGPLTYGQFSPAGELWLLSAGTGHLAAVDTTTQQVSQISVGPMPVFVLTGGPGEVYVMSCGPGQSLQVALDGYCPGFPGMYTQIQGFSLPENQMLVNLLLDQQNSSDPGTLALGGGNLYLDDSTVLQAYNLSTGQFTTVVPFSGYGDYQLFIDGILTSAAGNVLFVDLDWEDLCCELLPSTYGATQPTSGTGVYDAASGKIIGFYPVDSFSDGIALGPGGHMLYTGTADLSNSTKTITAVDVASGAETTYQAPITWSQSFTALQVCPDGNTLYGLVEEYANPGLEVLAMDAATGTVNASYPVDAYWMVLAPDGSALYLSNGTSELTVINTTSGAMSQLPIPGGTGALAVSDW
jgi:hypothetical protein